MFFVLEAAADRITAGDNLETLDHDVHQFQIHPIQFDLQVQFVQSNFVNAQIHHSIEWNHQMQPQSCQFLLASNMFSANEYLISVVRNNLVTNSHNLIVNIDTINIASQIHRTYSTESLQVNKRIQRYIIFSLILNFFIIIVNVNNKNLKYFKNVYVNMKIFYKILLYFL